MAANVQSNFVPNVWAARFIERLMEALVWGRTVNMNYEGAIAAAGDKVKVPVPTSAITVKDYAQDTDIDDYQLADGNTVDLDIDKQRYVHFGVDDIDRAQSRPDVMDEMVRWAAYQMGLDVDQAIREEVSDTAFDAGRRTEAVNLQPTAAGFVKAFVNALTKTKRIFTEANIRDGALWAIVGPDVIQGIEDYYGVSEAAGRVFTPATSEQALRNGFSGRLVGFDLYVTNQIGQGNPAGQAATKAGVAAGRRVWCGRGNTATTFATQLTRMEAYRPEKRFADAIKSLAVYGVKCVTPDRLRFIDYLKET